MAATSSVVGLEHSGVELRVVERLQSQIGNRKSQRQQRRGVNLAYAVVNKSLT